MTTTINLVGARGGVGTTTIATALAIALRNGDDEPQVSCRSTEEDALRGIFSAPRDGDLAERIAYNADPLTTNIDYKIVDHGTDIKTALGDDDGLRVLVVRNDYQSLRRTLQFAPMADSDTTNKFDIVVAVMEPDRALNKAEVLGVLGTPATFLQIPADATISRAVDAGVLNYRFPEKLAAPIRDLATVVRRRYALTHREGR